MYRIFAILIFLMSGDAFGSPYELSYGGRLTLANGAPVAGPVGLRVTFFRSSTGSDQVPVAIPDFLNVPLHDGIFQITFSLGATEFHTIFNALDDAYIQVEDLSRNVVLPRQKFSAVPYALKVPVDGTSITFTTDGKLALGNGSYTLTIPVAPGGANKVLKSDGANGLVWGDDEVTGAGAISTSHIQDGTITNADIAAAAGITVGKISGLGGAATKDVGTGANDVAAGDHAHAAATTTTPGFMSDGDKVRLNAAVVTTDTGTVTSTIIADGTVTNADVSGTAAIATSKLSGAVTDITGNGLGALATKSTVSGTEIDNGAVSLAKLSSTMCAANQILRMNATGDALVCAAILPSFDVKAANYMITANDAGRSIGVTAEATLTLPALASVPSGFTVRIYKQTTQAVAITPAGADTIEGSNLSLIMVYNKMAVTLINSGSEWILDLPNYGVGSDAAIAFLRQASIAAVKCGGAGDSCYDDATAIAAGVAWTPSDKQITYAGNVWTELPLLNVADGSRRYLAADGQDSWQLGLNSSGQGHAATELTKGVAPGLSRVCPASTYLDDGNKFTPRCAYATSTFTYGWAGLAAWNTLNGGAQKWFATNSSICSGKLMRLPTIYEYRNSVPTNASYPAGDGTPTFSSTAGIVPTSGPAISATSDASSNLQYMAAYPNTSVGGAAGTGSNVYQYCIVPSN